MTIQGPSITDVAAAVAAYRDRQKISGECPLCKAKDVACLHQKMANVLRAISGGLLPRYQEREADESLVVAP